VCLGLQKHLLFKLYQICIAGYELGEETDKVYSGLAKLKQQFKLTVTFENDSRFFYCHKQNILQNIFG
jgi:hypothetical protein